MTTTHTPGPWHIHTMNETDGEFLIYTGEKGTAPDAHDASIATIAGALGWNDTDGRCFESEANARLIAAAPQLLAALQGVASAHASVETCDMPPWLDAVEDAIAAAQPQTQTEKSPCR